MDHKSQDYRKRSQEIEYTLQYIDKLNNIIKYTTQDYNTNYKILNTYHKIFNIQKKIANIHHKILNKQHRILNVQPNILKKKTIYLQYFECTLQSYRIEQYFTRHSPLTLFKF